MTKSSSFESLRIFCKSHVIFTFTYETEAHIHLCKKASQGRGVGAGRVSWRGSQQQRLGLRPPWKHRPSQQVAVLGSDLNLFWKKDLKKVTVNQQKIIKVCVPLNSPWAWAHCSSSREPTGKSQAGRKWSSPGWRGARSLDETLSHTCFPHKASPSSLVRDPAR